MKPAPVTDGSIARGSDALEPRTDRPHAKIIRASLLTCGILSSLLYVAMNLFVARQAPGYNAASQTVSELSAIGAQTRSLWIVLAVVYAELVIAFGLGVWQSAGRSRVLQVVAGAIIAQGVIGPFWPPMHQREALAAGGGTLTDTLHIWFTIVWAALALVALGFGAAAFGRRFRNYSIVTLRGVVLFGVGTAIGSPRVLADLPTPWIGVWERINIGLYTVWIIVLAVALLQSPNRDTTGTPI